MAPDRKLPKPRSREVTEGPARAPARAMLRAVGFSEEDEAPVQEAIFLDFTKFADIIGEIDPAKLVGGVSMSTESALHFGLIPRMHRGIFAMNELPELDELVQVGMFNILEERDVQIRGYPIRFDIDTLLLFSASLFK